MLFCVVSRGVERMRPLPVRSSADSATSRLNAPLTAPSARPIAEVAPWRCEVDRRCRVARCAGRSADRPEACCVPPTDRRAMPLFGNARFGRVAEVRRHPPVQAPLDADVLRKVAGRQDDAGFDFDLRLGPIEGREKLGRGLQPAGRSVMISVFVRSSIWMSPRAREGRCLMSGAAATAFA